MRTLLTALALVILAPVASAQEGIPPELRKKVLAELAKKVDGKPDRLKDLPAWTDQLTLTKPGEYGRFPYPKTKVVSVIDKKSGIISAFANLSSTDPKNLPKPMRVEVVVSGVDTSEWVDDVSVDFPPGIYVATTKKVGAKTYLHLVKLELTKDEAAALVNAPKP